MYLEKLIKDDMQKNKYSLFAQSDREQPLEVNVMVTVEQFCDVCMKNLKMTVVGNKPDEDFIWCKCPECDGIDFYPQIKGKDANFHKQTINNNKKKH
jgi:hypothetical protein